MRTKVTLVLLFLNVALFYYIFYLGGRVLPITSTGEFSAEAADIQSIEISAATGTNTIRLDKRADGWFITQPFEWRANDFAVRRIVNELQFFRPEASFAVDDLAKRAQTLVDFGLDKPPVTVSFTPAAAAGSPKPAPVVLRVGNFSPDSKHLYVLSPDGKRIHVVSRSLVESLTLKAENLRDDRLFTIPVYETGVLALESGGGAGRVRIRHENDRWMIESPITTTANPKDAVLAVTRLQELRVKGFIGAGSPDPGLSSPVLRISIEGNKRWQILVLGNPLPRSAASAIVATPAVSATPSAATPAEHATDYYARMEYGPATPTPVFIVSMPDSLFNVLRDAQKTLRERRLLDFNPASVSTITLSAFGLQSELTLQRLDDTATRSPGGSWQIARSPLAVPADRDAVNRLLKSLSLLSAEDFVDDAPTDLKKDNYGFSRPVREVTLAFLPATAGARTPEPVKLLLASPEEGKVYAKLSHPDYVYLVSPEILKETAVAPLGYRERVLRTLPAGAQITSIKLFELGAADKLLFEIAPPPVSAATATGDSAPAPAPLSPDELLVKHLRTLRAKTIVAEEFRNRVFTGGEERPWKYRLEVTLSLVGGAGAQPAVSHLFFAERMGGGVQMAGSSDFNVVFEAEQPLIDAIFTRTYGPRDPGPPALLEPKPAAPAPAAAVK